MAEHSGAARSGRQRGIAGPLAGRCGNMTLGLGAFPNALAVGDFVPSPPRGRHGHGTGCEGRANGFPKAVSHFRRLHAVKRIFTSALEGVNGNVHCKTRAARGIQSAPNILGPAPWTIPEILFRWSNAWPNITIWPVGCIIRQPGLPIRANRNRATKIWQGARLALRNQRRRLGRRNRVSYGPVGTGYRIVRIIPKNAIHAGGMIP